MMPESIEKPTLTSSEKSSGCVRCISWNAIIVPALIAIGLSFLLYLFTSGLSLTAFTSNADGQLSLAIGGFVWLIISGYMSMFLVGWIAGAFVRPYRCLGVAHGFAAWCLALILTGILFSQTAMSPLGKPAYFNLNQSVAVSQTNAKEQVVTPTTKETVNKLGIGVLAIFFVFFAGALGSCIGGYVGSRSKEEKLETTKF